jgi:hypothetical protein
MGFSNPYSNPDPRANPITKRNKKIEMEKKKEFVPQIL